MFIAFGGAYPPPQAFYFKGFCEIFFSKILAILASQPPFLAHSSKHLYMIQITFLDPIQRVFVRRKHQLFPENVVQNGKINNKKRSCFPCFVVYVDFCSIFCAFLVVRLYQKKNAEIQYKHTTVLRVCVVCLY